MEPDSGTRAAPGSRIGARVEDFDEAFAIDAAATQAFARDGFAAIDAFLAPDELASLRAIVEPLLSRPEPAAHGFMFDYLAPGGALTETPRIVQLLYAAEYAPALFEHAFFRRAASLARALIGGPLVYGGSHLVEKPPRADNPTPWHQDEAFWEDEHHHEAVAVWVPLSAVDRASGCMEFVPESQRGPVLPHRPIGGDRSVHGLEIVPPYAPPRSVECPLALGGATAHHCRTIHATRANVSGRPRVAAVVNFSLPLGPRRPGERFDWKRGGDDAPARVTRRFGDAD